MAINVRTRSRVAAVSALTAAILLAPFRADAAKPPEVTAIREARGPSDASLLVLEGKRFKDVLGAFLRTTDGAFVTTLGIVAMDRKSLTLAVPPAVLPGPHDVVLEVGELLEEHSYRVSISAGRALPRSVRPEAIETALRTDLDDAETLSGNPKNFYQDAANLSSGTLSKNLYSALDGLDAEGSTGPGGTLVPGLFSSWEDLGDEGRVDTQGNLSPSCYSAWADLVDEGVLDTDGRLPDTALSALENLKAEGKVQSSGQWDPGTFKAWDDLQSEGYRDGTGMLSVSRYSAWDDLVAEGKVGLVPGKVAPGVHDHAGRYISLTGGTMTGPLKVDGGTTVPTGTGAVTVTGSTSLFSGVYSSTGGGKAVGLRAVCGSTADGSASVLSETKGTAQASQAVTATGSYQYDTLIAAAGYATATSGTTYGVYMEKSGGGFGLWVGGESKSKVVVRAETSGSGGTALEVRSPGPTGNLATFNFGTNVSGSDIRIDAAGKGYFNAGTQNSGADFAESVRVDRPAAEFEPGDVLVVDREAIRGFALCRERASLRVAGVVSEKPAILGSVHDIAGRDRFWAKEEVALGIVGIVPVKVCDENGPVAVGDLLVSASAPGHAMKAPEDPVPGTVLGKVLQPLKSGRGRVETLLTVQ